MEQNLKTLKEEYRKTELGKFPTSWKIMQLKDFLIPEIRAVKKPTTFYKGIGIRSHGKGTFLKPNCNPKDIALDTLYEVKYRDLIVNITFAWEGAIALVKKEDDGALVSHRFPTYTFNEKIVLPEFFQYVILQRWFVNELGLISPGSAGRNRVLRKTDFLKIKVPIPPIEEQKKIADILTQIKDSIITSEDLINSLNEFKRSAMKHLFTYGAVNFDDIDKVELKETEIGMMPKDWEVKKIKEITTKRKSGGTPSKSKKEYWNGKIPFVLIEDMTSCKIYLKKTKKFITKKGLDNSSAWLVPANSLLLSMYATIGATAINKIPVATNQAILAMHLNHEFNLLYGAYLLHYSAERLKMQNVATTQKNVNKGIVENFKVPLPPPPEQQKIASILSAIDSKIEAEEKKKKALEELFNSMLKTLLTAKIRVNDLEIGV